MKFHYKAETTRSNNCNEESRFILLLYMQSSLPSFSYLFIKVLISLFTNRIMHFNFPSLLPMVGSKVWNAAKPF